MKKIAVLFLMFFTILACKKKDVDPESSCSANNWEFTPIESPMKNFFFKDGSYWILQNDSTKHIDSTWVSRTASGCEAVYLYQGYGYNWEFYQIFYKSSLNTYVDSDYDMIESNIIQRNGHPSEYPPYYGRILYSTADTSFYSWHTIHIDSMNVGNNTFYQVQLSNNKPFSYSDYKVYIYTAYGIGTIRKVVVDSLGEHVWNLIRWEIIK